MEIETNKGEKILVSIEDYEHLKQFKWTHNNSYIVGYVNNKSQRIHRYIMIELVGHKELTRHNFIDHINGNKLDNRRENLRIVTVEENNRNKTKRKDTLSKYLGVSKKNNKYTAQLTLNDQNKSKLYALYEIEEHAAYQYDLWVDQYNIIHAKKNNIEKPDDFIEYVKKDLKELPMYIYLENNKYRVRIKNDHIGTYKTLEEAIKIKDKNMSKISSELNQDIIHEIKRNDKNECIIELFNKKKEKVEETIVDEDIYYDLLNYKWVINNQGYIRNNKLIFLHRFIMNYNGDNYVDHINNNPLDNRKENLRIVTPAQNAMNKKPFKNGSSKFIGVFFHKKTNKWCASITFENMKKYLGTYQNEIDAAKARDLATKKFYGEYGKLNFPNEIK